MRVPRAWVPALAILAIPLIALAVSLMGTSESFETLSTSRTLIELGPGSAFPEVLAGCGGDLALRLSPEPPPWAGPPEPDASWSVTPAWAPDAAADVTWRLSAFRLPSMEPIRLQGVGGGEDRVSIMRFPADEGALLLVVVQRNGACGAALLG